MDRFAALLGWVEHQLEQPMAGEGSVESKLEPKSALAETESQQKEPEVGEESLLQVLKRPLGQTAEAVTIQAEAPTAQSTAQEQAWQQIAALSTTVNRLVEQLAQEHTELLRLGTLQSSIEPKHRAGRTIAAMTKSKAAAPIVDALATGTDAELPRAVRSTESAEAKINAAIDAVVAYNYAPGRTHEDRPLGWLNLNASPKRIRR